MLLSVVLAIIISERLVPDQQPKIQAKLNAVENFETVIVESSDFRPNDWLVWMIIEGILR